MVVNRDQYQKGKSTVTNPTLTIQLISSGWKKGTPPKADLYLDCRGIPNPHKVGELSGKGGADPAMLEWVRQKGALHIENFIHQITDAIPEVPNRRLGENWTARPFVVACMCAYGVHRSVAIKNILLKDLPLHLDELAVQGENIHFNVTLG